jgi:hypothetical protein
MRPNANLLQGRKRLLHNNLALLRRKFTSPITLNSGDSAAITLFPLLRSYSFLFIIDVLFGVLIWGLGNQLDGYAVAGAAEGEYGTNGCDD